MQILILILMMLSSLDLSCHISLSYAYYDLVSRWFNSFINGPLIGRIYTALQMPPGLITHKITAPYHERTPANASWWG